MRADVSRPNIVLSVHPHGVGANKEIICDAAKEFSGSIKLHQRMLAAVKHVDMSFGIYRYTRNLNEMFTRWQLKEIRNHFVIQLRNAFLRMAGKDRSNGQQRC